MASTWLSFCVTMGLLWRESCGGALRIEQSCSPRGRRKERRETKGLESPYQFFRNIIFHEIVIYQVPLLFPACKPIHVPHAWSLSSHWPRCLPGKGSSSFPQRLSSAITRDPEIPSVGTKFLVPIPLRRTRFVVTFRRLNHNTVTHTLARGYHP